MSICAHAQECVTVMCINTRGRRWSWRTELGGRFSAMEDGEDSVAGPSQRMYLAESSAETSAERSRWLATLTKKKARRGQYTVEAKRATKSSKVESTYWRVSTSQVLFFWLLLNPAVLGLLCMPYPHVQCAVRGIIRMPFLVTN